MKGKLTVSDSKKLFHELFPYVIPGIYKKIVDEILVELNLLGHQSEFNQEFLFCVGLTETFKELTRDYSPNDHLNLLFESLCSSTNFEAEKVKDTSDKTLKDFKDKSSLEISNLLKEKVISNLYPSRILNLGIYIIISNANDLKGINESEKNKIISNVYTNLNLSTTKAEKDIGIYISSLKKMAQAKELIEELKIKERKKVK